MLRIRLRRVGKKGKPSYRIVVADVNAPRDGAYVEWIGNYDPMADPPAITIKKDRAIKWLSEGAQPSDAVRRILDREDILVRAPKFRTHTTADSEPEGASVPTVTITRTAAPAAVAVEPVAAVEAVAEETASEAIAEEVSEEAVAEETAEEVAAQEDPDEAPSDETVDEAR
ncbi:MAG: 30S ribosomal protein S16 [Chloroflexi bacterium]|nr:30S ribosomal protein S16 [Chloroflexota bacterium]